LKKVNTLTSFIEVYGTRTIESKIDDTVAELVRENQTNATHLMEQLVYLYRTHYDCSPNDEITYEDSCDISVSRGGNGLSINITFPLAESYGRGR
jgi:hypothetical protein